MCFSSALCVTAAASTIDEAVISQSDDKYVPLYTKSADSVSGDISDYESSTRDNNLSYTEMTFLALLVGYLIIFKTRGLKHNDKMHSRKKQSEDKDIDESHVSDEEAG